MHIHAGAPEVSREWPDPEPIYAELSQPLVRTHFKRIRREAWDVIVSSIGYWGALTVGVSVMVWDMIHRPVAQGDLQGLPVWLKWLLGVGTYAFLLGMWWRQAWPAMVFLRREEQARRAAFRKPPQSEGSGLLSGAQAWSELK